MEMLEILLQRLSKSLAIASCGVPVFLFDYRGYGRSEDAHICEKGLYQDAESAYDWLKEKGYSEIIIHVFRWEVELALIWPWRKILLPCLWNLHSLVFQI